jgi:hypothetical protein
MPRMAADGGQFLLAVFVTVITMAPVTVDGRFAPDAAETARPFMHVQADGSTPVWAQNAGPVCEGPMCQLVVRVSGGDITAARLALMGTALVKCLHYVPHDAFIGLFLAPVLPDQLCQLDGVESVHRTKNAMKIARPLQKMLSSDASSRSVQRENVFLDVLCCVDATPPDAMHFSFSQMIASGVKITHISATKLVINTPRFLAHQVTSWLIQREDIFFVQLKPLAASFNLYTMPIIKGSKDTVQDQREGMSISHLNGEDEIVGVADTGPALHLCTRVVIRET